MDAGEPSLRHIYRRITARKMTADTRCPRALRSWLSVIVLPGLHRAVRGRGLQRLCITAGIALATAAQAGTWVSYGPEGGDVHALAIDPASPDTVYGLAGGGGVFKSGDGGGHWAAVDNGLETRGAAGALANARGGTAMDSGAAPVG